MVCFRLQRRIGISFVIGFLQQKRGVHEVFIPAAITGTRKDVDNTNVEPY